MLLFLWMSSTMPYFFLLMISIILFLSRKKSSFVLRIGKRACLTLAICPRSIESNKTLCLQSTFEKVFRAPSLYFQISSYVVDTYYGWGWERCLQSGVCVSKTIEIYHPSKKSWTIAFVFPKDLKLHVGKTILLCKGLLFCGTSKPPGIMVYNIHSREVKETINLAPFPCWPMCPFKAGNLCRFDLIACGSTIILVAASPQHFILWEFEMKNLWNLKEIARMPESLYSEFLMKPPDTCFVNSDFRLYCEHIGVGDYVCFRNSNNTEVIAYNLRQQLWGWLPSRPDAHAHGKWPWEVMGRCRGKGMGFEPRLDVQLSFPI
ncbi:hypothetical protein KI387_024659 [Taxus chinensis]|uniref:F-box protein n=1 Tax=Taxus chinensis TaxID=29808 RepID=A0AA38G4T5_TAXCH|nr:hypothetical protein KI387_024659 [Taxus chinensis]